MTPLTVVVVGAAGAAAVGLFVLTARHPLAGCAALALTVPLTAGLARGALIPMLKPGEAILVIVLAGVVAHRLTTHRVRPVGGLDLAVGAYAIGSVAIPWSVLTFTRYPAGLDTWWTVLSPVLFVAVYYIFSRSAQTGRGVQVVLSLVMVAGVVVCGIAVAELLDVSGVRSAVQANYPAPLLSSFRPGSTLGSYSALGAFGALLYLLALAIASVRQPGFSRLWLILVMAVGAFGVIVSHAWAPLAALPVVTLVVVIYARKVPGELVPSAGLVLIGLVIIWPQLRAEFNPQVVTTAQGFVLPETMSVRIQYWNEFIVPAISNHAWLGTGTLVPSSVPAPVAQLADNEYLWAAFRAGLPGVVLLLGVLLAIGLVALGVRSSPDPSRRAFGAATLATVVMLILLGGTAQYFAFAGLSQIIAMLVGAFAGLITQTYARRAPIVVFSTEPQVLALPGRVEA